MPIITKSGGFLSQAGVAASQFNRVDQSIRDTAFKLQNLELQKQEAARRQALAEQQMAASQQSMQLQEQAFEQRLVQQEFENYLATDARDRRRFESDRNFALANQANNLRIIQQQRLLSDSLGPDSPALTTGSAREMMDEIAQLDTDAARELWSEVSQITGMDPMDLATGEFDFENPAHVRAFDRILGVRRQGWFNAGKAMTEAALRSFELGAATLEQELSDPYAASNLEAIAQEYQALAAAAPGTRERPMSPDTVQRTMSLLQERFESALAFERQRDDMVKSASAQLGAQAEEILNSENGQRRYNDAYKSLQDMRTGRNPYTAPGKGRSSASPMRAYEDFQVATNPQAWAQRMRGFEDAAGRFAGAGLSVMGGGVLPKDVSSLFFDTPARKREDALRKWAADSGITLEQYNSLPPEERAKIRDSFMASGQDPRRNYFDESTFEGQLAQHGMQGMSQSAIEEMTLGHFLRLKGIGEEWQTMPEEEKDEIKAQYAQIRRASRDR